MPLSLSARLALCATMIAASSVNMPVFAQAPDRAADIENIALQKEADRLHAAKDYPALLPVMEKLVASGNSQAANNLAVMYEDGLGVEPSEDRARDLYRASADKGYAPAQAMVGYSHLYGRWGKVDTAEAARWCKLAAEQREPDGLICLAQMHGTGNGFPENAKIAADLLQKAVALDSIEAMRKLGMSYLQGFGVQQSNAKGIEWLRKAANMGDADAMLSLGDSYRSGDYVVLDELTARDWYKKASDAGHIGGKVNLALMLVQGVGGEEDADTAFVMMTEAAEMGDVSAQINLATMYEKGKGTRVDEFAAHQWLNEAARSPDLDDEDRATVEFRLACLCHSLTKQQMAKAKATSPMPAIAAVAARK
jgi:TPR repeat protein